MTGRQREPLPVKLREIQMSATLKVLLFFVIVTVGDGLAAEPQGATGDKPDSNAQLQELKSHFGEQQFSPKGGFVLQVGQPLPPFTWERPRLVAKAVHDITIPTRWFNEQRREVKVVNAPGRYYAYGEAPTPNGLPLRRAVTCCCVDDGVDLAALAERRATAIGDSAANVLASWQTTEAGAVELAAILEGAPVAGPKRVGQWQMENATRHVRLKRKLMGLEREPTVRAVVQTAPGPAAPELREASGAEPPVSPDQLRAIESKLDEWYDESQEPMAVVIARRGVIVVSRGYGEIDGESVTVDTPMLLHSAMKPLIGLQLAMYVDQGSMKLDEPIGNFLPGFDSAKDRQLTFRAGHVHATGILFPWELAFRRLFYFHTWHESLIAHCPREWSPGAKHRYGVVGVILSVRALELLRGRNYWDAMERDLLQPLGIHNVLPGGTGFSAESLARIGVVLANGGRYGDRQVVSKKTWSAIIPQSLQPHFPDLDMKYGIGLQNHAALLGPGSFGHGGGCGTLLTVNPQRHLVFAMVRNGQGEGYKKHRAEVLALLREWDAP